MNKPQPAGQYNPDVLTCLANLSNDEVFTPPSVANVMIDMLPTELFTNPNTRFLDPCCKSGVFLREIAKRLLVGLEKIYPDLQERVTHIFNHQLYGIAVTDLTAQLSRRSLYCSKKANGKYSVTRFDNADGQIRFKHIQHTWKNGKCEFCGSSQREYDREEDLETHAYEFIHTETPQDIFNMKFDVIIGNPPYQLNDGGGDGSSAKPIYNLFVEQAKKLNPHYLIMIIPARWYSGGKGLDEFRESMLNGEQLAVLHDFPETADCFPGINIRGGICYFLWDRNHKGKCVVFNHKDGKTNQSTRPLLENGAETFIRYNEAISILKKIQKFKENTMDTKVSSRQPFGIPSNFENYSLMETSEKSIVLYRSDRDKNSPKQVYVSPDCICKNLDWKNRLKVLVSKASPGGDDYPHAIISTPILAKRNSVCTETYLIVDFVATEDEGKNLISYMKTRFFRFLVALVKNTQNISKSVFSFVPVQSWNKPWSDGELYRKYSLTEKEITFIESMIRPMEEN